MLRVVSAGAVCFSWVFAFIGVCVAESSMFGLYARQGTVAECVWGVSEWEQGGSASVVYFCVASCRFSGKASPLMAG